MQLEEPIIKGKEVVFERLKAFGFDKREEGYYFHELILDGQFEVLIQIDQTGQLLGRILDRDMAEDYTAFRVSHATGFFVGQVREAYLAIVQRVVDACFIDVPCQSRQANHLVRQLKESFADQVDYPFDKNPEIASFRVPVNRKWYALLFPLNRQKLSDKRTDEPVEVLNLKVDPLELPRLLGLDGIYQSYHMSKKNWVSIILDDSLSDELIWELTTKSRQLVAPKGYQATGQPDYWIIPANPKYYDIDAEFATNSEILWTQKAAIQAGDYVAIYMTAPDRCLRYFCQVLQADLENDGYRERSDIKKLMKLRLLTVFGSDDFSFERLSQLGIKTIRGPRRVTKDLYDALVRYRVEEKDD